MQNHLKTFVLKAILLSIGLSGMILQASATPCNLAPKTLVNSILVLQVETLTSDTPDMFASKGVIVQTYLNRHAFSATTVGSAVGIGSTAGVFGDANYQYRRNRNASAVETATDTLTGKSYTTHYKFTSRTQGYWQRQFANETTHMSGRFVLNSGKKAPDFDLAPAEQHGLTVVLNVLQAHSETLPAEAYPGAGTVILQSYRADGSYEGKGFGPGTVDHFGTFTTTKVAPTVVVEETQQTIPAFNLTLPFTMVYTYETAYSGTWFQNFGDGLIRFSGTFTTFATADE